MATNSSTVSQVDFSLENYGSILLLRPLSDSGRAWVEEHIGRDNGFQPYWPTVVIEPRYVADVLEGINSDGMLVR